MIKSLRLSILLLGVIGVLTSLLIAGQSRWTQSVLQDNAQDAFVAKDVVADILPPPMYLIELRLVLSQALEGSLTPQQAQTQIDRLVSEYNARVDYWTKNPPDGLEKQLLGAQHSAALAFIAAAQSDVMAKLLAGDSDAARKNLDAVHALVDTTAVHILEELAAETDALAGQLGRPLTLIAESDRNDPRFITPRADGGYGLTAQWDDDIHHALHTAVSGERHGYYGDFGSLATLAETLKNGYFHAGSYSSFRRRRHGRPLDTVQIPATRLLAYTCTHDQVGNRAIGDRPSQYLDFGQLAVKAALVLGSPYTAMLFMGEEWGASTPFQFFSSMTRTFV